MMIFLLGSRVGLSKVVIHLGLACECQFCFRPIKNVFITGGRSSVLRARADGIGLPLPNTSNVMMVIIILCLYSGFELTAGGGGLTPNSPVHSIVTPQPFSSCCVADPPSYNSNLFIPL